MSFLWAHLYLLGLQTSLHEYVLLKRKEKQNYGVVHQTELVNLIDILQM